MEIITILCLIVVGVLIGVVVTDWNNRAQLKTQMTQEREQMKTMVAKLSEVNNSLVISVQALEDRLAAAEMKSVRPNLAANR